MSATSAFIKPPSPLTTRQSAPQRWRENIPTLDMGSSRLVALSFTGLLEEEIPERPVILCRNGEPLFREGDLIQIFASRGVGKSWFARTLALLMATGGEMSAMGFTGPKRPIRVLYIDGEMASRDIQERDNVLAKALSLHGEPHLHTIGADWQDEPMPRLDTDDGQAAVEPAVEWADVVIIDNRACLFNAAGERDPVIWQDAQRWILDLRRRCKTVILVHHANVEGRTRGISNAEDILNFAVELSRPEDYDQAQGARFRLRFTKSRGAYGVAVEEATYALTESGWVIESSGSQLTQLDRRIIDAVTENECATRSAVFEHVGGKRQAFYQAFDKLEEKHILVERKVREQKAGRWVGAKKVWVVERPDAVVAEAETKAVPEAGTDIQKSA